MDEPEIDNDGYPTDETIKTIEKWDTIKDAQGLFDFVIPIFNHYGRFTVKDAEGIYEVATGGWSGCEDAIGAMQRNYVFWGIYWRMSKRGGYYEFNKPKDFEH